MKQKMITIILTLIAILAPILILPNQVTENYNILKYIVLLICGAFLLILLLASYKTLTIDKKDILILAFMFLVFLSTCLSSDINQSIWGGRNRYEGLLMFLTYACIYLTAKKYFNYSNVKVIFNIIFVVSMIIGILGIAQLYVECKDLYPIFNKGINGTFGNSNFFGSYISIILPAAIAIFVLNGNKRSFILAILLFFNMASSGTRSAWVAFAVVMLIGIIYLIIKRDKKYFIRAFILIMCFTLTFSLLYFDNTEETKSKTKVKVEQIQKEITTATKSGVTEAMGSRRIAIWKMTLEVISKEPFLGCGPDNLTNGLRMHCKEDFVDFVLQKNTMLDKAHNEYLQIAATIGIPAVIIYLGFIAYILLPKLRKITENKVNSIMMIAIISYLAQAFFNISTIGVAPLFWMLLGLIDNEKFKEKVSKII